jgi:hypothetical protein
VRCHLKPSEVRCHPKLSVVLYQVKHYDWVVIASKETEV